MAEAGATNENPRTRRETSDIDVRAIGWIAVGLVVFLIGSIAILGAIFTDASRSPDAGPSLLPPEPRLQTDPAADLRRFNARIAPLLSTYGYIDRAKGIVRIPIDEAMQLVIDRGISDWPGQKR
jgi:hypothetical protein